jgi:hypothetical protein
VISHPCKDNISVMNKYALTLAIFIVVNYIATFSIVIGNNKRGNKGNKE